MRIIECVVGFPGAAQDSRVWAGGSNILKKPRQYLDEGEFIWTDGGYGFSPFTVGPYTHKAAESSRDLRRFNYALSTIRIRAEHGIAFLKNRFQSLKGYRGNIYRDEDDGKAAKWIMACIIAHNFASRYDRPQDVAEYLFDDGTRLSEAQDLANDLERYRMSSLGHHRQRQLAQNQYEREYEQEISGRSAFQVEQLRRQKGVELKERLFLQLFSARGWVAEDTNAESRRHERTIRAREQQRALRNARARERRAAARAA
jgi:hypothetical protein